MNITQITVSYGETQSLPEYSNVKPNITITAMLDAGEDIAIIEAQLWSQAKAAVREQIDLALEANNIPAKWSTEPRYQVLKTRTNSYYDRGKAEPPKLVAIIPNALKLDDRFVHAGYHDSRKLRAGHAARLAAAVAEEQGYTIVDCSDGNVSRLLALLPEEVKAEEPPAEGAPSPVADELLRQGRDPEDYHEIDDEDDLDEDEDDEEE